MCARTICLGRVSGAARPQPVHAGALADPIGVDFELIAEVAGVRGSRSRSRSDEPFAIDERSVPRQEVVLCFVSKGVVARRGKLARAGLPCFLLRYVVRKRARIGDALATVTCEVVTGGGNVRERPLAER